MLANTLWPSTAIWHGPCINNSTVWTLPLFVQAQLRLNAAVLRWPSADAWLKSDTEVSVPGPAL